MSKVIWYETPVAITLDTVSVILSKYRNTTITSSTTIHGNLQTLNASKIPVEASLQNQFTQLLAADVDMELNNYYASMGSFVLANGTNGVVGGVTSIAYPTPYLAVNGFILYTSISKNGASDRCLVSSASEGVVQGEEIQVEGLGVTTISLQSTYYTPIPDMVPSGTNLATVLQNFFENVGMDTSSFSAFLQSDTKLMSSLPILASCHYQPYGFGPPAVKIPVTALTTTSITTSEIQGNPSAPPAPPAPESPVRPPIAQYTTPLLVSPQPKTSNDILPVVEPSTSLFPAPPNQFAPTQAVPGIGESQPLGLPVIVDNMIWPLAPSATTLHSNGMMIPFMKVANQPVPQMQSPILTFGGSAFTIDSSFDFVLGSETLKPGSPGITVFGTHISLAPGGSFAVIGSSTTQIKQAPLLTTAAVLAFDGTTYIENSQSAFVIAGQTLARGSSVVVSGTPIFLPSSGNDVIVGSSTQPLSTATVAPLPAPVILFAGKVYAADSASGFEIDGQTLTKGGVITLSGTPVSFANNGDDVVIGTNTQGPGIVSSNGFGGASTSAILNATAFRGGAKASQRPFGILATALYICFSNLGLIMMDIDLSNV